MESGSQSGRSLREVEARSALPQNRHFDPPPFGFAQLIGTAIALLTLVLPVSAIFIYSAGTVELPRSFDPLSRLRDRPPGYTDSTLD
jgi:hypothetical protein